jgi:hypothetical protein
VSRIGRAVALLAVGAGLAACGTPIGTVSTDAELRPAPQEANPFVLASDMRVRHAAGQIVVLPRGSRWSPAGSCTQGTIYRRADGVLELRARYAHEAYLVVSDGRLVAFYIPARSVCVAAPASPRIPME